jgi:hypothetical protein
MAAIPASLSCKACTLLSAPIQPCYVRCPWLDATHPCSSLLALALCAQVVVTETGEAAQWVAKYRPPCPVVVVSNNAHVLRMLSAYFGLYPCQVGAGE